MIGNRFWKDFGDGMEAFLRPDWPSEATLKASVIKYENQEGSRSFANLPPKIFNLGPQCERETGRASQADDTPNGVGGFRGRLQSQNSAGQSADPVRGNIGL